MNDIVILWQQAQSAQQANDFEQAQYNYEKLLQLNPDHVELLIALGLLMAQQSKLTQALIWFEKAIILDPGSLKLHYYIANTLAGLKRWDQALDHFQIILKENPNHAHAHNNIGRIFHKKEEFDKAYTHYRKALQINPHYLEASLNLGLLWVSQNNIKAAQAHFQSILEWQPHAMIAHEQLAQLALKTDNFELALHHYDEYLALNHHAIEAWNNRGAILMRIKHYEEAMTSFLQVLKLAPQHASARYNLATLYLQKNQLKEAIWEYTLYLRLEPSDSEGHYNLGVALMMSGQLSEALQAFQETLALNTYSIDAWCNLAAIYTRQHEMQKAYDAYQKVLSLQPEHSTAQFMVSALLQSKTVKKVVEGEQVHDIPHSAPLDYVRTLFNNYAAYFDDHLQHILHYQVPQQLYHMMSPYLEKKQFNTLDLGCGTGLSALAFQSVIKHLIGVDIASEMLMQAKEKGLYHDLIENDLISFCQDSFSKYDLILCVDTLVYFGELTPLFEAISNIAAPNAYFGFSIETYSPNSLSDTPKLGYQLQSTGRYQHHLNYIIHLAQQTGWRIVQKTQVKGRMNQNEAVNIGLFLFQKISPDGYNP
jgi:predicted TPR repeat methyltransferase